jgi:hypothetical protein
MRDRVFIGSAPTCRTRRDQVQSSSALAAVQAAFQAELEIQSEASGKGLKVFRSNNSVKVTGVSVSQLFLKRFV